MGGGGEWGARVSELFLKYPNLKKKKNIFWGIGGGGAGLSDFFFTMNPN